MDIALVGLPSAGKSSIINSLVGKRIAQSGVSRTTIDVKLYDNLNCDDNINYKIYDLPGIADVEDNENKFDTLIFDTIKKCNMVIWVSDIIKSFITNHEMKEFIKIQNHIKNVGLKEGIPIQLIILLSKVDKNLEFNNNYDNYESCIENIDESDDDEIKYDEETTIIDIYKNVKEKFKDVDIICFNAHGRSYYHKKSSTTLKNFVKQYNPNNININFNLKKYYDNIPSLHDLTKINYFVETHFKTFLNNTQNISNSCDTDNINIPDNLILWCKQSNCLASNCKKKDCTDCNNDQYHFACKCTHWILNQRGESNGNIPNTTMINGLNAIKCRSGCNINFSYNGDKILCKHGYNRKKCINLLGQEDFRNISNKFVEIYNSIYTDNNKLKLIRFILYDDYRCHTPIKNCSYEDLLGLTKEYYNKRVWNIVCRYIKINIKTHYDYICNNYLKYKDNFIMVSYYQLYRIIQISNDLDIYKKLYIFFVTYPSPEHRLKVNLNDGMIFVFENIYNIEYLLSGEVFDLKFDSKIDTDNCGFNFIAGDSIYYTEIYKTSILKQIKEIRKKVFGNAEDDIDINMIPIAYEKYGLIWNPNYS